MSSRTLVALVITWISAGALVAGSGLLGCSDDPEVPNDASAESAKDDVNRRAPPETDARPKTCREQCEEAHPTGLPRDEAVNSCWDTHCLGPCIEQIPDDGGIDGAAPDGGTCTSPVVTISLACDQCTNTFCCAEWDGCFQEPECVALNACYQQCTE